MSSGSAAEAKNASETNRVLAEQYYGIALPALSTRLGSINQQLAQGEPQFLKQAYMGQRTGLTEGFAARDEQAQVKLMEGSKKALSGGNPYATLSPADVGAQLANALYGSKFQEGQANLNQQFNLMSMGLGGAGTAGNAALTASGQELRAIGYMPNYNQTLANVAGIGALGAAGWGGYQQWLSTQPGQYPGTTLPPGQSWSSTPGTPP